jgi:hypothetical protein
MPCCCISRPKTAIKRCASPMSAYRADPSHCDGRSTHSAEFTLAARTSEAEWARRRCQSKLWSPQRGGTLPTSITCEFRCSDKNECGHKCGRTRSGTARHRCPNCVYDLCPRHPSSCTGRRRDKLPWTASCLQHHRVIPTAVSSRGSISTCRSTERLAHRDAGHPCLSARLRYSAPRHRPRSG